MFCSKCGNQLPDNVETCPNCNAQTKCVNKVSPNFQNDAQPFKCYIDTHIRNTTKFQSAQDLIHNSKPWNFMWIIVALCAILGLIIAIINEVNILPAVIILSLLGFGISAIIAILITSNYGKKFSAKINTDSNIDIANLCEFLSKNLCDIYPHFNEWSLVKESGLVPYIKSVAAKEAQEVTIGCEFGEKKKTLAEITIKNKPQDRAYYIRAGYNGFLLNFRWEPLFTRSCLIKTAPILQAAMEFYITHYQNK